MFRIRPTIADVLCLRGGVAKQTRCNRGGVGLVALLALLGMLAPPPAAAAGRPDAMSIVRRMKVALEAERPSTRTLVLTMRSPDGTSTEWTARQARKRLAGGNRILTVILGPDDVKGVALLIWERKNKPDEQWLYLPTVRRVRQLIPVGAYESFLGTDFTFADLGFVKLQGRKFSLLGTETLGGVPAYKVQEVLAGTPFYYSRIVTWVAKESMLPLRRDFYDATNELWKTETFQDVAGVDGVPTVMLVRMEDKRQNTSTELQLSEVRYDAAIPDDLFDPQRLPQASKHPLWTPAAS